MHTQIDPERNHSEREFTGETLRRAFLAAINGTDEQLRAFVQLCALEGI